jgi:GntR family transcriptional repressor for pyruvate dehydrogenase complex
MTSTKKAKKAVGGDASETHASNGRLYQRVAHRLFQELANGKYAVGDRLPAERELAVEHDVSRPAVREAMIALEVQGLIDVRVGSGAYVRRLPGIDDRPGFNVTAFELTEARLLFEGESAALAATNITDAELDELEALVRQISDENQRRSVSENADRDFHMLIARSTRNLAIVNAIEELWRLRSTSPECALLHAKARAAKVRPVVEEHSAIVEALRTRDPAKARAAMRAHLAAVIDHLLFATEEQALAKAREAVASTRRRFGNVASI